MTREEIKERYGIDDNGVIESPGMFEGEMCYAPYYYDLIMSGAGDEEIEGQRNVIYFDVTEDEREEFPELGDSVKVKCWNDDQGFFYCETVIEGPVVDGEDGE